MSCYLQKCAAGVAGQAAKGSRFNYHCCPRAGQTHQCRRARMENTAEMQHSKGSAKIRFWRTYFLMEIFSLGYQIDTARKQHAVPALQEAEKRKKPAINTFRVQQ